MAEWTHLKVVRECLWEGVILQQTQKDGQKGHEGGGCCEDLGSHWVSAGFGPGGPGVLACKRLLGAASPAREYLGLAEG